MLVASKKTLYHTKGVLVSIFKMLTYPCINHNVEYDQHQRGKKHPQCHNKCFEFKFDIFIVIYNGTRSGFAMQFVIAPCSGQRGGHHKQG